MKFICLIHVEPAKFEGMTEAEHKALDAECLADDQSLLDSGHLIAAGPLAEPETATLVRVSNGKVSRRPGDNYQV